MVDTPTSKFNDSLSYVIRVDGEIFEAESVKDLLAFSIRKIVDAGKSRTAFPYKTVTGKVIVSEKYKDIDERYRHEIELNGQKFYLNSNHPKFYGIRLAISMLDDSGFNVEYAGSID